MAAGRTPGADEPLSVDGARPSVAWVSSLPESWTKSPQRLVLMALACDGFTHTSRAPVGKLARWCGLSRSRAFEILTDLTTELPGVRPALLERVDQKGQAVPNGAHWGGVVGYRLRWEASEGSDGSTSALPSGVSDGSGSGYPSEGSDGYGLEPSEQPSEQPSEASDTPIPSLKKHHDDVLDIQTAAAGAGKDWDRPGINAAVRRAVADGRTRAEALRAGLLAAADPAASTPAALCWARYYSTAAASEDAGPTCDVCAKPEPACRAAAAKAKGGDPHEFTPNERTRT